MVHWEQERACEWQQAATPALRFSRQSLHPPTWRQTTRQLARQATWRTKLSLFNCLKKTATASRGVFNASSRRRREDAEQHDWLRGRRGGTQQPGWVTKHAERGECAWEHVSVGAECNECTCVCQWKVGDTCHYREVQLSIAALCARDLEVLFATVVWLSRNSPQILFLRSIKGEKKLDYKGKISLQLHRPIFVFITVFIFF